MSRFDRRAALWAVLAMFSLVALLSLSTGLKECGPVPWIVVFLPMTLIVFVKFPWVLLIIAFITVSIGFLWPQRLVYRTLVKLLFVLALIAVPAVTFIVVPSSAQPCEGV